MDLEPRWTTIDLMVLREPTLEVRAEPNAGGGWHIRGERSVGQEGVILFGYLAASAPGYTVQVTDVQVVGPRCR